MHRAGSRESGLQATEGGAAVSLDRLFPQWSTNDRFGIVMTAPYEALGASLLVQAAITLFYGADASRRSLAYPEIYLFHAGGRFGDHSYLDFWPARKEVFVEPLTAVSLLEAINERAITRLALPDGAPGELEALASGPSTWAEQNHFRDRVVSCLSYAASGDLHDPDLQLRGADERQERNIEATLDPVAAVERYYAVSEAEFLASMPGPSVREDIDRWRDIYLSRVTEVTDEERRRIHEQRGARANAENGRVESFRRLDAETALARLAGIAAVTLQPTSSHA